MLYDRIRSLLVVFARSVCVQRSRRGSYVMYYGRVRFVLVVLLVVFMTGAVGVATAQAEPAPFWSINKTRLGSGETRFITGREYNAFTIEELGVKISCDALKFKSGVLLGTNESEDIPAKSGVVLELETCTLANNGSGCKLEKEPIVSVSLGMVLAENTAKEYFDVVLHPAFNSTLFVIKFTGTCIEKEITLAGEVAGVLYTDPGNGTLGEHAGSKENKEAKSWLINFPTTPIEKVWLLENGTGSEVSIRLLNSTEAKFTGTMLVSLTASKEWGASI